MACYCRPASPVAGATDGLAAGGPVAGVVHEVQEGAVGTEWGPHVDRLLSRTVARLGVVLHALRPTGGPWTR